MRSANVRDSGNERTDIREVIDRLNHMQEAGVIKQYAIGGAVGASFWVEPIETEDEEAVRDAVVCEIDQSLTARVMTLEHLAALALELGRPKDKARLVQFVTSGKLDRDRFSSIVSAHGLTSRWTEFRPAFKL